MRGRPGVCPLPRPPRPLPCLLPREPAHQAPAFPCWAPATCRNPAVRSPCDTWPAPASGHLQAGQPSYSPPITSCLRGRRSPPPALPSPLAPPTPLKEPASCTPATAALPQGRPVLQGPQHQAFAHPVLGVLPPLGPETVTAGTPQADPRHRTAHNNNKTNNNKTSTPWEGESLISRVTTLLSSSMQRSTNNHKACKETGKYGPFKGKIINRICP